ncbi:hypothetical protein C2S52_005882 [Perilla frutescens var. hirtella]|nr:hypothetical protein C2S52_005882 [Perilla frutescens var. hirtella]
MVEIITMVKRAPQQLADATQLKKFLNASHQLLGPGNVGVPSTNEAPVQTQFINTQADDEFWGNPDMIAMIEQIETAMAKRNEFIKNLPDGPGFSLGLTQEGHAGLKNENEYLDFSLMDDDAEDVQFVRSGRQSRGIVINDNGNADERICDKQRLENDQMVFLNCVFSYLRNIMCWRSNCMSLYQEKVIKQNAEEKLQRDVEHFGGYTNEISKEKEFVEPLPHQMEKRNRANIKKIEKFMSPYVVRAVDISGKVSKHEKELWYWIFYNDEANNEDILCASDAVAINRGDILIMRQNTMIRSNILDAWSSVMNHKELSCSLDSPYRFFASTNPSVSDCIV